MKRTLALLALALVSPARALDDSAGTGGAAFLKLGLGSARAMSLGRAYVALAEGADSLTWNPAGLALAQTRELGYSYLRGVQGVSAPVYFAYAHPLGRTVVGANLAYLDVDGFDVRDESGRKRDSSNVTVRSGFGGAGVARSFWYEKLFVGGGLKGIHEDNAGARRAGLVLDFGLLFKPGGAYSFGFASQNFGASPSRVARVTRLGAAARALELFQFSLETSKHSDNDWKLGLGAEFTLPEELLSVGQISLRAGYHSTGSLGTVLESDRHALYPLVGAEGLSFGLGLFSSQAFGYGLGVDYALIPLGALGTTDIISLKARF